VGQCSGMPAERALGVVVAMGETIYVELLGQGVTVIRPVTAIKQPDGSFVLPSSSPPDERWAFPPGSRVECELRDLEEMQPVP
jgi:hypothetical protein